MRSPDILLRSLFERVNYVLVPFSGGKESVVLADMVEPWRDRVCLVWLNTGDHPSGKADFIRAYGERFTLVEAHSNPRASWLMHGPPADVVSVHSARPTGQAPRIQPWTMCCARNRSQPLHWKLIELGSRLREQGFTVASLVGQREDDRAYTKAEALAEHAFPEPIWPLWSWSEEDVMTYIAERNLKLPPHYEFVRDSIDCLSCPADMTAQRLAYLVDRYPTLASEVRHTIRRSTAIAIEEARRIEGMLATKSTQVGCPADRETAAPCIASAACAPHGQAPCVLPAN